MSRVNYIDLPAQNRAIEEQLIQAIRRVIRHGGYILGPEVAAFETAMAKRLGAGVVVGVNSGTDALILALRRAGVNAGDEVITAGHTFVATATAIRLVGATPVLVDIDEETMLIDPAAIEAAIGPKTRAVVPIHLNGAPCDMTTIVSLCDRFSLRLIEDCAQSIGAQHKGRCVGTFGLGAFSLHPLKVLSAIGDGGFITAPAEDAVLRQSRNLGLKERGHAAQISGNSRLDTLQAAILLVKLAYLDQWIEARRANAAAYREALSGVVRVPTEAEGDVSVYSAFVVRHPERDALLAGLIAKGVDAKIHYPIGVHHQEAFPELAGSTLPRSNRVMNQIISLPVSPELNLEGRARVIEAVLNTTEELSLAGA